MGSTQAAGLAFAVHNEIISLETALRAHLVGNHYPPLPADYASACREAVEAAEHPYSTAIVLPNVNPLPKDAWWDEDEQAHVVWAGDLIKACHLEAFLNIESLWED